MQLVNWNNKQAKVASKIEELDRHQYMTAAEIILNYKETSADLIRMELMKVILKIDDLFMDEWKADCIRAYGDEAGLTVFFSEIQAMYPLTDFFFNHEEDGKISFKYDFTRNPFPIIKTDKVKLFGPKDELINISFYELWMVFSHYDKYLQNKDEDHLNTIISILYRPPKPSTKKNRDSAFEGDIRLPLYKHEGTIDSRKKIVAALDKQVKDHIIFFFTCSRVHIIDAFPDVFSGKGKPSKYGYAELIWEMAGNLANEEKISNKGAYEGLAYLDYMTRKNKK